MMHDTIAEENYIVPQNDFVSDMGFSGFFTKS